MRGRAVGIVALLAAGVALGQVGHRRWDGPRKPELGPEEIYDRSDTDEDGVLSKREWEEGVRKHRPQDAPPFHEADGDGDGVVDRAELRKLAAARGSGAAERGEGIPGHPRDEFAEEPADGDGARGPVRTARWGDTVFPLEPGEFWRWADGHRALLHGLVRDRQWMRRHVRHVAVTLEHWQDVVKSPEIVLAIFSNADFWVDRAEMTRQFISAERMREFRRQHPDEARELQSLWGVIVRRIQRGGAGDRPPRGRQPWR